MFARPFCAIPFAIAAASFAAADQLFTENVIVQSQLLCVGTDCRNGEPISPNLNALVLRAQQTAIFFDDTSSEGFNTTNWSIQANSLGAEGFYVTDLDTNNVPFSIEADADHNALYVAESGFVGLGTALPQVPLHVYRDGDPSIFLESFTQNWGILANNVNFGISDLTAGSSPVVIRTPAPNAALVIESNGNTGLGTDVPEGKLHTKGDGVQLAYFESSNGGAVQVRFRTDSENRRFLAVNNANEVKSQIVFGDNQIQFLGQTVAQEWLRISSAGIVSSGPTCNPNPCDATFDPEVFTVPPIAERAALMWENMHLPAVGPTQPGKPFNLTEKTAGMLHELEIAHIYIGELNSRLAAQEDRLDAQAAEIAALKALITKD